MSIKHKDLENQGVPELILSLAHVSAENIPELASYITVRLEKMFTNGEDIVQFSNMLKTQLRMRISVMTDTDEARAEIMKEIVEERVKTLLEQDEKIITLLETMLNIPKIGTIAACDYVLTAPFPIPKQDPGMENIYRRHHAVLAEVIFRFKEEGLEQKEPTRMKAMHDMQARLSRLYEAKKD